jgi:hypothetical protein
MGRLIELEFYKELIINENNIVKLNGISFGNQSRPFLVYP